MPRLTHRAGSHVDCPLCRDKAARAIAENLYTPATSRYLARTHAAAIRRAERDRALRDLGLKKVRGALGGTYWE